MVAVDGVGTLPGYVSGVLFLPNARVIGVYVGSNFQSGSAGGVYKMSNREVAPLRSNREIAPWSIKPLAAALAFALRAAGRVDFVVLADAVGVADTAAPDAREDWLSAAAIPAPASEAHTPTPRAPTPSHAYARKPRAWPE